MHYYILGYPAIYLFIYPAALLYLIKRKLTAKIKYSKSSSRIRSTKLGVVSKENIILSKAPIKMVQDRR